jgi:nitrogen-specific signal transduction histidine kinase
MFSPGSDLPESDFLKTLLQPLLEDFQYWFGRSRALLENHTIDFLEQEQQVKLLERVKQAQQEVNTTQLMFQATGGQVGVDTSVLMPWHQLVTECWQVGMKFRMENPNLMTPDLTAPEQLDASD